MTLISSVRGDIDGNPELSNADNDLIGDRLCGAFRRHWLPDEAFDINLDGFFDRRDYIAWAHDLKRTWLGDADLDGQFSSSDLVAAFSAGQYEVPRHRDDGIILNPVGWAAGDWNGDGHFNSGDLVVSLADGGYEEGRRPAAVPEPAGPLIMLVGCAVIARRRRM